VKAAAIAYDVPRTTLRNRINGMPSRRDTFVHLVREIMAEQGKDLRIQALAISALQEAVETTLIKEFESK
jgi:histone H3/H4